MYCTAQRIFSFQLVLADEASNPSASGSCASSPDISSVGPALADLAGYGPLLEQLHRPAARPRRQATTPAAVKRIKPIMPTATPMLALALSPRPLPSD